VPCQVNRVTRRNAALSAAVALLWLSGEAALAQLEVKTEAKPSAAPPSFSTADCATCHEAQVTAVQKTHHGRVEGQCSVCHGDPSEHLKSNLEKGEPGPIIKMTTAKPDEINKTCLSCHEKGNQANWHGGVHERRGLACTSCHSIHSFKSDQALLKTALDSETCFSCHAP